MAQAPDVAVDEMALRRKLLDKIDRARDLHSDVKAPLKQALTAVVSAYEQEKDDPELELAPPSLVSFKGMLRFLGQPHRSEWWPIPAIALNPEGHFLAIWDIGQHRLSVEFMDTATARWVSVQRQLDGVKIGKGEYQDFDTIEDTPFTMPTRKVPA